MIMGAGLGNDVACLTDSRLKLRDSVLVMLYPKPSKVGPIGLLNDGDVSHSNSKSSTLYIIPLTWFYWGVFQIITINAEANTLEVALPEEELKTRQIGRKATPVQVTSGTLYEYQRLVSDASHSAVTDLLDIEDLSLCAKAQ
ncbi:hypothetical protein PSTT_09327 [Puccinia striiformis]|uniref:Uncharacterized protein n=1 Tax=Puccinia striiformis TaxID=27350 RepID=A0A2S4V8T4_9BASI|nr:hypothetical protein PSTT_09327 [Puccinia striiformis]